MILLILFAFIAGIVTILSPCILPVLPIVLASTVEGGKQKPFGIVAGFIASFTLFTLFLSSIVKATGISADSLRTVSVVVILVFGISLLVPKIQVFLEHFFSKLAGLAIPIPGIEKDKFRESRVDNRSDFVKGLFVGVSLGLIWTPCVGPILASVISLALTGTVTSTAFFITSAYAAGTALPMFALIYGGRQLLLQNPWLVANTPKIQKTFGVLMIVTAVGIYTNVDRKLQTFVLDTFPNYGTGLTKFEDNAAVKKELEKLQKKPIDFSNIGKPMYELMPTDFGSAPELITGGQWFNTNPLTLSSLKGKVVLIDFWTYTCINCIRTLPYLKSWDQKYRGKGLVIIGVHTPEFEFEKNPDNVAKAIKDFGLEYPIMQDNNYATWTAYDNHYWPAEYLIDKNGKIRRTHFGEGDYDKTEKMIQTLLEETGVTIDANPDNPQYQIYAKTPELYLGFNRLSNLFTNELPQVNKTANYSLRDINAPLHHFGYIGDWTIKEEWAEPSKGGSLQLWFEAKEVYLVMRPTAGQTSIKMIIRLDGQPVAVDRQNAGEDVTDGVITVTEDRLYKLIKLNQPGRHHLYLEFLDGGIELYAFTFG